MPKQSDADRSDNTHTTTPTSRPPLSAASTSTPASASSAPRSPDDAPSFAIYLAAALTRLAAVLEITIRRHARGRRPQALAQETDLDQTNEADDRSAAGGLDVLALDLCAVAARYSALPTPVQAGSLSGAWQLLETAAAGRTQLPFGELCRQAILSVRLEPDLQGTPYAIRLLDRYDHQFGSDFGGQARLLYFRFALMAAQTGPRASADDASAVKAKQNAETRRQAAAQLLQLRTLLFPTAATLIAAEHIAAEHSSDENTDGALVRKPRPDTPATHDDRTRPPVAQRASR